MLRLRLAFCGLMAFGTGCGPERTAPETVVVSPAAEPATAAAPSPLQQLVALYPSRRLPLQLSTQDLERNLPLRDSLLQGRPIPPALVPLLDAEISSEGQDVFALAKLELPNQHLGLLTRVPGVYVSSRILLFVLDQASGKLTDQCEVAETFGDAGDAYIRTSVLSRDARQQLLITISQQHCAPTDSTMETSTCVDSTLVYQLRGGRVQLLSRRPKA